MREIRLKPFQHLHHGIFNYDVKIIADTCGKIDLCYFGGSVTIECINSGILDDDILWKDKFLLQFRCNFVEKDLIIKGINIIKNYQYRIVLLENVIKGILYYNIPIFAVNNFILGSKKLEVEECE